MKKRSFPIILLLALVTIGAIVAGVAFCSSSTFTFPLAPAPTPLPTPTQFVRTGPLVINAIRTRAKLETVIMNFVNDQEITRVGGIGGLCTERITYLAYYDVVAGVDLGKITTASITVTNDGFPDLATITITVPPAEILNVVLDTQNSRLVAQDTPTWIPGCETQVAAMTVEAQQLTQQYAREAAIERGILKMAQEKAGQELKRFLLDAGYWNVNLEYANPE